MNDTTIAIIFPHQLFEDTEKLAAVSEIYLVEEDLFFNQYKFHKQKLVLHRASMQYYFDYLKSKKLKVHYIDAQHPHADIRKLVAHLGQARQHNIAYYDVADDWLEQRIAETAKAQNINLDVWPSPMFINQKEDLKAYFEGKKKYFQANFYSQERTRLGILMDENGKPQGDQWSFDADNRLKYPKTKTAPKVDFPQLNPYYQAAEAYVVEHYGQNYGDLKGPLRYPSTHQESAQWLQQFLAERFADFGTYEDAIVPAEHLLHHSLLTPMLNIGLLTPKQIIDESLNYAQKNNIAMNNTEGFVRQIIGWREFIRGVYHYKGREQRTRNFWQFERKIPSSFYTGTTGILPIDQTIKKVLATGYCHHIERLMLLGNMMLLCEFSPDEVYQWFMEMFVDAYDWVMVPNVYGMSQFADGGLMSTKPYISGSSYVLKMSHYPKGDWCEIWDALFWDFMQKQRAFFGQNPRLGLLLKTYDKMTDEKKENIQLVAENFKQKPNGRLGILP
jgi:deoxyribodipyrimidine photolyase-related protein